MKIFGVPIFISPIPYLFLNSLCEA